LKPFEPLAISLRNAKQPSDGSNGCIANSLFKYDGVRTIYSKYGSRQFRPLVGLTAGSAVYIYAETLERSVRLRYCHTQMQKFNNLESQSKADAQGRSIRR
jgi:hypothetical protein